METLTTVEIVQTALELTMNQGQLSTTELMIRIDAKVSHSDIERVLFL